MAKRTTPYWTSLIKVYENFCVEHFRLKPTWKGKDFNNLKQIVDNLEKYSLADGFEWTEQQATQSFYHFLSVARKKSDFLRKNFTIPNINSNFDPILRDARTNHTQGRNSADFSEGLEAISAMFTHSNNP